MAATSTIASFLMEGAAGTPMTWAKLVDIKDYPDMFGDPNQLQATTLSDHEHWYVEGVKDNSGALNFTANYDAATFSTLKGKEGTEGNYALWFGEGGTPVAPTGANGKFSFKGYLFVKLVGKGVDEVREMVVGIIPSTAITFAAS